MNLESLFKKNIKSFFSIMLLFCLLLSNQSRAQKGTTVSGVVKDETGFPLPGVNIVEKGTRNFSTTDMDGKFKVKLVNNDAVLELSYIGFEKQSVSVAGKSVINVTLKSNAQALDEVKIVSYGYGTIKKENLTGSVSSVTAKELSKVAVTNVAEALAGRMAGVTVQSVDGAPGADIQIRVRGGSSISQSNAPLYVVDGFIVSSLTDIPSGDIESIDVLKDAATTAIYGSQASNGVVVVTTKKAKAGKTTVNYNHYMQLNTFPAERKYDVLSPYEFATMQYETTAMTSAASLAQFTKDYGAYGDLELYKYSTPIDKQDQVFGTTAVSQFDNFSITGGTEATRMMLSVSSNRDEGILPGSGLDRFAVNFKMDHDISKKLKLHLGARMTNKEVKGAGTSGSSQLRVSNITTARPTNGILDQIVVDYTDPLISQQYEDFYESQTDALVIVNQDYRNQKSSDYIFNAGIDWNILSDLKLTSTYSSSKTFGESLRAYGPKTNFAQQLGGLPAGVKSDSEQTSYRLTNILTYNVKNLKNQELGFLLGQEAYSNGGNNQTVQAGGFRLSITPEELFSNMQLGDAQYTQQSTYELTDTNRASLFARVNYAYNDRYLFTGTIRRDQSSIFQKDLNVGYFPAFSLGWKINKESFMKNVKFVNELKLRVSYGETGNDKVPTNSTSLLFSASDSRGPGFINDVPSVYYTTTSSVLFNPKLKWETTTGKNIGLDFRLFNSFVSGTVEAYRNETKDLLVQAQISQISGFSSQWQNIGTTSNEGAELSLNFKLLDKKNYSLNWNFNVGINKFKIDNLGGVQELFLSTGWASTDLNDARDYYLAVGKSMGLIYGYKNDGYYKPSDFASYTGGKYILKAQDDNGVPLVNNAASLGATLRPGMMKLKDLNGDGVIDVSDRTVIGNTTPKATGGFGLTATVKGFDISTFFNWSYGNDEYNTGKIAFNQLWASNGGSYLNMLATMDSSHRFTYIDATGAYGTPGAVITDLTQLAEMNANKTIWSGNMSFGGRKPVLTDYAIEDASFLRLNNVTIGYTIPMKDMKKRFLSNVRLFVTGTNLAIWTKYSGYDPDTNSSRGSDGFQQLTPGLDFSSYPKNRSYSFGLNVTF